MNEQQLPPLPENPKHVFLGHHIYTADQMHAYARAALAANVPADLLAALRTAVDHIDMGALELSHCKDWAQIKEALAAPAPEAKPEAQQPKPLTDEQIMARKPASADFVSFRSGVRCIEIERASGVK